MSVAIDFSWSVRDRRGRRAVGISLRLPDFSVGNFLPFKIIFFSFRGCVDCVQNFLPALLFLRGDEISRERQYGDHGASTISSMLV
jgi:hypothetical protein